VNIACTCLLTCFAAAAFGADVLTIDDGEKGGTWGGRNDGKIANCDVRTTFNASKIGDGSILMSYNKPKGGWAAIGRGINADWTAFSVLRFWVKMTGLQTLEVRLTDDSNENFITKVTAKTPGEWEYVTLPFASFVSNPGYQAKEAKLDGMLNLKKVVDLNIMPLGDGEGRVWLDQVDVAIIAEAQAVGGVPAPPAPAKLFELDAELVKKSTKVDIDGGRIGGRLSPYLASGWGEDVGEFGDNPVWSDLVRTAGFPLMRVNARLDRLVRGGAYDTWLLERDIAALKAAGSETMVVLDGTPVALGKSRDNPMDQNAWADIAAAIVQKINIDQKLGVKVWQIWQDADVKTSWTGTPEEFSTLAARAAERMKRVDPSIVVLSGGLSRSSGVRTMGQQVVSTDGAIDGLSWSTFAFEKVADGNATDALDRTWGFERTFVHLADLSRAVARPLMGAVSVRVAAEKTVYNPRLDSIFGPVYFASSINHLARQHALFGMWQNATPQRTAGLIDAKGKPRPLVSFLGRLNTTLRDRQWYWIESETGTAQVESLAAISGDRLVVLLINKDALGTQFESNLKFIDLKFASGTQWTLGRGVELGEEKPMTGGGTRVILPPTSVTVLNITLAEPTFDPSKEPELQGGGRTVATIHHVDHRSRTFYANDKDGRSYVVAYGDQKPVAGKKSGKDKDKDKEGAAAPTTDRPFLPGMQLEITGKKKPPFVLAEKCVIQGETAAVPLPSDSGFNLAERTKGRKSVTAEMLKPGFDPARLTEMSGKPQLAFTGKQLQGTKDASPQDSDFSAKIRLAWDAENLYVAAIIQDDAIITGDPPSRWDRQDSVVLGFDTGFDTSAGTNDENDTQIVAYSKDKKGNGLAPLMMGRKNAAFGSVVFKRPANDSHTFLITVPWSSLGFVPEPGRRLGFNIVLTDSDKDKESAGFFEWAGGMSNVSINAQDWSQFGMLELK
jgi:hypothetical protein